MEREPRVLSARSLRARLRDPRSVAAVLAVAGVIGFAALAALTGRTPDAPDVIAASPTPTATQVVTERSPEPTVTERSPEPAAPSPSLALLPNFTPVPPEGTPEGVDRVAATSAPIGPPRWPGPTPTPDPNIWRFEGVVVDTDGKPLENVCLIIGPGDCPRRGLRTDDGGRYSVDLSRHTDIWWTFRFVLEGYETVLHRTQVSGPTVFNVVLRRT